MDDQKILALFQLRSEEAIVRISEQYGAYCRRIITNILPRAEDAEEILSDTWLVLWDAIPPEQPASLKVYAGRVARNLALNRWKSMTAEKRGGGQADAALEELSECLASPRSLEDELDDRELRQAIDRFLRAQPEHKRNVFIRRYWAMEPVQEVAGALGMTRGQTATLLWRLRRELKAYLEKEGITV